MNAQYQAFRQFLLIVNTPFARVEDGQPTIVVGVAVGVLVGMGVGVLVGMGVGVFVGAGVGLLGQGA